MDMLRRHLRRAFARYGEIVCVAPQRVLVGDRVRHEAALVVEREERVIARGEPVENLTRAVAPRARHVVNDLVQA